VERSSPGEYPLVVVYGMGVMLCSDAYTRLPRATEPEPVVRPAKTQKGPKKGASGRTRSRGCKPTATDSDESDNDAHWTTRIWNTYYVPIKISH